MCLDASPSSLSLQAVPAAAEEVREMRAAPGRPGAAAPSAAPATMCTGTPLSPPPQHGLSTPPKTRVRTKGAGGRNRGEGSREWGWGKDG